jgi:lipoprotein-anchoring transpeptidase ErfK/SrfK
MRILVVLALTAALVWAGFRLFNQGPQPVHGSGDQGARSAVGVPDDRSANPVVEAPSAPPVAVENQPPAEVGTSNPFERVDSPAGTDQRAVVDVAGDLAHGRFDDVLARLASSELALPPARVEVLRCLVEALAGRTDSANAQAAVLYDQGLLGSRDVELLQAALGQGRLPAPGAHTDPLDLAAELAVAVRVAEFDSARGRLVEAAAVLTRVFRAELDAPWATEPSDLDTWVALLRDVHRRYRWDPRVDWPHVEIAVQPGDGLTTIRQRVIAQNPGLALSTGLIARANRLGDGGVIHAGQVLRVPTEPVTVLVDVSKNWLLYSIGPDVVEAWPVGTGADGKETLLGEFVVGKKQSNPTWWPRNKEPVPFGHPDNPLGTRWLGWRVPGSDTDTSFGFHGTWLPETIGEAASEGCVRMRNEDVEVLYEILPQDSRFLVRR